LDRGVGREQVEEHNSYVQQDFLVMPILIMVILYAFVIFLTYPGKMCLLRKLFSNAPLVVSFVALIISFFNFWFPAQREQNELNNRLISARNLACYATRFVIPNIEEAVRGDFKFGEERIFQRKTDAVYEVVIFGLEKIDLGRVVPPKFSDQLLDILNKTKIASKWQGMTIGSVGVSESTVCTVRNEMKNDIAEINAYVESNFGPESLAKCENTSTDADRKTRKICDSYGP
jgi:hypothetical protein